MEDKLEIGTLLRLPQITKERISFMKSAGLKCCQLAGITGEWLTQEGREKSDCLVADLEKAGLKPVGIFLSFPDQNWNVETEIGLLPESNRARRMTLACRQMLWAKRYDILRVSCHVGAIPEGGSFFYTRFIADLRELVSFARDNGQKFLFETGPESVALLKQTFADLAMDNVGINFDPANLLIYDRDDPSVLVRELSGKIEIVHCKDAVRRENGQHFGHETVLGQGETHFAELMRELIGKKHFRGPLVIERELAPGPEQEKDIAQAVILIEKIKKEILSK